MIFSMVDSLFSVSLHIIWPMSKGERPFAAPFVRSMVEMRSVRAQSSERSQPCELNSAMSRSASSEFM